MTKVLEMVSGVISEVNKINGMGLAALALLVALGMAWKRDREK